MNNSPTPPAHPVQKLHLVRVAVGYVICLTLFYSAFYVPAYVNDCYYISAIQDHVERAIDVRDDPQKSPQEKEALIAKHQHMAHENNHNIRKLSKSSSIAIDQLWLEGLRFNDYFAPYL